MQLTRVVLVIISRVAEYMIGPFATMATRLPDQLEFPADAWKNIL